ncbi:MAG: hypothetical protein ACRET8_01800 [Burkholderiales bacterium]
MKTRLSLAFGFALLAAVLAHAADTPSVKQRPVDTPHRILFVGNSYFYYNDSLHNHVRRMVDAAGIATEKQLHYKSATIGGAPLSEQDVKGLLVPGRLGKEPFEIVILQGNSGAALTDKRRQSFHDKVVEFNAEILKAGAKTVLYMTHAYVKPNKNASPDMIRKVEDLYVSVGNEVGAYVIPVGLAFEESYRRRPDFLLHKTYDGSHPNMYGTYLAACVVFAIGAVDKESAAYLQQVAWDTVQKFYTR